MKKIWRQLLFCLSLLLLLPGTALANKSSVSIEAPQTGARGAEVIMKITVTHKGNSALHYTNRLRVLVNKKEVVRWDFTSDQRPEGEIFTREFKMKVMEDLEVIAEANCNIHGSAGPTIIRILAKY